MSRLTALGDLLNSVFDRRARALGPGKGAAPEAAALRKLVGELMSSGGEASGAALATEILQGYRALDPEDRRAFFDHLAQAYDPDPRAVSAAAAAYAEEASPESVARLFEAAEPSRQELLRRLNMAPGGTAALVGMRADLLAEVRERPDLRRIDQDFRHLLGSWFNRGFLVMRPIDWETPASILEKIIAYEAVHQIDSWEELRRRVQPPDRRCFAFFHPSMPNEPLIFVEVALTRETPGSIRAVLAAEREQVAPEDATTAVFYSISNCQPGLAGVSFGAFLIKQVARDLSSELPRVETFVTLSPVPGFVRWLKAEAQAGGSDGPEAIEALAGMAAQGWPDGAEDSERKRLLRLAARYFLEAKREDGRPLDQVARFHLANGAELEAIHWMGDGSERGIAEAAGLMVNYRYRLDRIEENHEAFAAEGTIAASRSVHGLAR